MAESFQACFYIFLSFILSNFSVQKQNFFYKNLKKKICPQKVEKTTQKSCILMAVGNFFFSVAPPAQNSPELHFRFIIFFIQPSLLESLHITIKNDIVKSKVNIWDNRIRLHKGFGSIVLWQCVTKRLVRESLHDAVHSLRQA
jgi:hypothetical protein